MRKQLPEKMPVVRFIPLRRSNFTPSKFNIEVLHIHCVKLLICNEREVQPLSVEPAYHPNISTTTGI